MDGFQEVVFGEVKETSSKGKFKVLSFKKNIDDGNPDLERNNER